MSAYYKAMYDYEGTSETELSFKAEEILEITHADGDWWYGRGLAGEGYIAPAFLDTTAEVAPPGLAAAPAAQPAAAPEPALPTQTPEEMRKNRAILLDQIIESEANFVQALEYFSATIFDSLSLRDDNFKRSFLADPSLGLCCSLLAEQLKFICSNFLESVRTARGSNDVRKLAAAFEQFAPSLQVFAQYTSENTNALNHLKSFGKALEDFIEAHPMPPGYSLESFFLLPVQHYTGYLRGFQQYVLLTPESDDGADVAQEALDLVAGFSLEVDEKLKLENERIILLAIQSKFVGNPPIYKPSRRFVKDGRVERLGEGKKPKVYHLHLFNDAILISSYNSVFDSFKFHKVVDLADGTVTAEVAFEVVTGFTVTTARMQRYTFRASNPEEAAEWMRTIGQQIAEIKAQADKMAAEAASGDKKPSKYSKRASMVRGPVGGGAPIATSLQQALAQANVPAMGARAKVLYLFLKQESDFCTQLQKLDNIVIQSLIAASKGAPLKVGAKESDAYNAEGTLFQQSNSTLSVIGGTFARMQAQAITDLLKQSGVQIYLRAAESLCGSIEQILDEMEIRASAKLWAETLEVGDVFTSLAATALCQQHEQYASCELESLRVIKSSNMSNFVKEAEAQLVPFTIDKLMGTPVNGPERYLKFFQELLAATPASHPDHAGLTASVAVLERTVNAVTDVMRVKRNYEKLIDIQSSFVTVMFPDPVLQNLVSSKRTYIQEGDLYKVCRKKNKKFRFFLFNDLLAYGASIGPGSYSWNRAIDLSTCQIKKLDNSVHQNAFEVLGDEKSFVVICGSPSELESWTTNIQNQMDALGNFAGSSKAVVAAVWVPDALGTNGCCVCNCEFTMFKRKHHCRKCGKIVCGDHSKNSIVLPISKKNEKLRVCDTCFKNKDLPDAVAPTSPAAPAAPAAPAQVAAAAPPVPAAAPEVAAPPPVPSMPAPPPAAETAYAPPVPSMVPVPVPAREEGPPAGMAPPPPPPPASTMMTAPSADSGFKPPPPPPPGRRRSLTQSTGEVVGLADAMSQGSSRSLVAPPPPPPPRAGGGAPPPPPPPPAATSAPAAPAMERPRMDLMSAIKSGSTGLKKVEVNAPKPPPPPDTSNLLGMLAVAMNDRRVAFTAESDDDSDASGFSDDD